MLHWVGKKPLVQQMIKGSNSNGATYLGYLYPMSSLATKVVGPTLVPGLELDEYRKIQGIPSIPKKKKKKLQLLYSPVKFLRSCYHSAFPKNWHRSNFCILLWLIFVYSYFPMDTSALQWFCAAAISSVDYVSMKSLHMNCSLLKQNLSSL